MLRALLVSLLLAACGHQDDDPSPPAAPSDPVRDRFAAEVARFTARHVLNGYVVTRKPSGEPTHLGEGILWAGVAMAHLPCAEAATLVSGIANHVLARGGRVNRFDPLPPEYEGRRLNFDGETGLDYGFSVFLATCPHADRDLIGRAWKAHMDAIAEDGGDLGSGEAMPAPFTFTQRALSFALGQGEQPSSAALAGLEVAAASWTWALHPTKAPAYRAHLAFRHLLAAEAMGYGISWQAPFGFCAASRGLNIPNVEHRCGRGDLTAWADGDEPGRWENRFQRAGYEDPDGNGDEVPRLDVIEALETAYSLKTNVTQ